LDGVQDHFFAIIHNGNVDTLTRADLLDDKVFKDTFKTEYIAAGKGPNEVKQHPFADADFLAKCYLHATDTGKGWLPWVPALYSDLRGSLCDTIKAKTAGVPRGDLVKLLIAIKIAVLHYERYDATTLEVHHVQMNMESCGNDLMRFLAEVTLIERRLESVGCPASDTKAQRVLLDGLDDTAFESFKTVAARNPYFNRNALEEAIIEAATKKPMIAKLRALQPGQLQSSLVTRAATVLAAEAAPAAPIAYPTAIDDRMDRLEGMLADLAKAVKANHKREICGNFRKTGTCAYGEKCKFEHSGYHGQPTIASVNLARNGQGLPPEHCLPVPFYML
jgi:hypothetical protein